MGGGKEYTRYMYTKCTQVNNTFILQELFVSSPWGPDGGTWPQSFQVQI